MTCWSCGALLPGGPTRLPDPGQIATVQTLACPRCDATYSVTVTQITLGRPLPRVPRRS